MNKLGDIVDQLTEDEATSVLNWLAQNKPTALREAFRNTSELRVRTLYRESGRPHS